MISADGGCVDEEGVSMGFDLIFLVFLLIEEFLRDFVGLG